MTQKTIMLSIHQKFALQIFEGTKCVELRKVKPAITKSDIVVVYVTSPIKQIWGTFEIENIIALPINELWLKVESDAGISKSEFDKYFSGTDIGYGIYLNKVTNVKKPIELEDIQKVWKDFHPPQSFIYLPKNKLEMIPGFILEN